MSRYSDNPTHVLRDVPDRILDAARDELRTANVVKEDAVEPLADAIVARLADEGALNVNAEAPESVTVECCCGAKLVSDMNNHNDFYVARTVTQFIHAHRKCPRRQARSSK